MPVQGGGETGAAAGTGPGRQDALALLERDHRTLLTMFARYNETTDGAEKAALAERICVFLEIHSRIEQDIFYPAARRRIDDKDLVQESIAEHEAAKTLAAQVKATPAGDPKLDARVHALHEHVAHHIQEEETELFPEVRAADIDLMGLGARLYEHRRQVLQELGGEMADEAPTEPRSFEGRGAPDLAGKRQ